MRTIGFVLFSVTLFLLLWPYEIYMKKKYEEDPAVTSEKIQALARKIVACLFWISGVKLTVKGEENLPEDQAVLFVGNHRGYFDVIASYYAIRRRVGFISKKEIEKVPFLSDWMVLINCLFLDRDNPRDGIRMIKDGVEKLKSGTSIFIFPEGTRSKGEDELTPLPFKEGSLKMAERAKVPVVPVAFSGTSKILEEHFPWIRAGKITMEFGKPFYISDLGEEYKKSAGAYSRERILEMLKQEKES